jgi:hypothetical protein
VVELLQYFLLQVYYLWLQLHSLHSLCRDQSDQGGQDLKAEMKYIQDLNVTMMGAVVMKKNTWALSVSILVCYGITLGEAINSLTKLIVVVMMK